MSYSLITLCLATIHFLGLISAIDALYLVRTSRSAIAWGISLIVLPYIALPAYWILGRSRFVGYRELIKRLSKDLKNEIKEYWESVKPHLNPELPIPTVDQKTLEAIIGMPFLGGNDARLLIDGEATFAAIYEAIRAARSYILVQFYILRDDAIGNEFANLVINKAREGVRVSVLYDEVGSKDLTDEYCDRLAAGGVDVRPFATRQGWNNYFQFNFRNHRKVVVVDGETAFVGGLNVGDEYLSRDKAYSPWRDTHLEIKGPIVSSFQSYFFRDWMWATQSTPQFSWPTIERKGDMPAVCVATGPADSVNRCALFIIELLNSAKTRVWLATPYFVPDDSIMDALQLAALRGVDVRILLPGMSDSFLAWWTTFSYLEHFSASTIKVYRMNRGFMHQKVFLVDDSLASVGTMNLDNRSIHLNFEIAALVASKKFAAEVEAMFEKDFSMSRRVDGGEFDSMSFPFRILAKFSRLFSPIL